MQKKLSALIRQGATLRPQGYGTIFPLDGQGGVKSCAIGAAYEAHYGTTFLTHTVKDLGRDIGLPHLTTLQVADPVTHAQARLLDVIMSLNDACDWSREQIADWLEEIGY